MANDRSKIQAGQSLFEVVVAIAISALIIVTIVSLVSNSLRNATFSRNNAQAASYAQAATEWLRTQRDNNIAVFLTNVSTTSWCFKDLSWSISGACIQSENIPGTPFLRQGNFSTTLSGGKTLITADVVVSWNDSQGEHIVTNSTNFTDWRQR